MPRPRTPSSGRRDRPVRPSTYPGRHEAAPPPCGTTRRLRLGRRRHPEGRHPAGSVRRHLHGRRRPRRRPGPSRRRHGGLPHPQRRRLLRGARPQPGDPPGLGDVAGARRRRQPHRGLLLREPDAGLHRQHQPQHDRRDRRHRGLPLLRARRCGHPGHHPRCRQQHHGRFAAGRLHHHSAVRQERPAGAGGVLRRRGGPARGRRGQRSGRLRPQAARGPLRDRPGGGAQQGRDPRAVPQHRQLR